MSRVPVLSGKEIAKALESAGFVRVGQKGSHLKLERLRDDEKRTVIVPLHTEIAPGTLKSIMRQSGINLEDFKSFFK